MNEAFQEVLQITSNCIINTCKQPLSSWLINFHGPFYLCVCRGGGLRIRDAAGWLWTNPLPSALQEVWVQSCTVDSHGWCVSSSGLGGWLCRQSVARDQGKGRSLAWVTLQREGSFCRVLSTQAVEQEASLPSRRTQLLLVLKSLWGRRAAEGRAQPWARGLSPASWEALLLQPGHAGEESLSREDLGSPAKARVCFQCRKARELISAM